MGFVEFASAGVRRLKEVLSVSRLLGDPIVRARPLHEQFQRIGGGLTPADVSYLLRAADQGQPQRLVDLWNESRQRDGHLQSVCGTREMAVALCECEFVGPEKPKLKDRKAIELCQRIRDEFENWPELVQHLTSAFVPGHATAEIKWELTTDGFILPRRAVPLRTRDFFFGRDDGRLLYQTAPSDLVGVDLLAENPGRIVQIQRRITGDAAPREGLIRVLVWAALFRNWTLRDWIALGEVGWKPWRTATYKKGATDKDIDQLVRTLEQIGSTGVGALPETTTLNITWPSGMAPGTGGAAAHSGLYDTLGREMSKAVVGVTTSIESGPNGDRAATETRDKVRTDIREMDAVCVAAVLRRQLFAPAIALNIAQGARVPVPWFQTQESEDVLKFAQAIEKLANAKVRIGQQWVRDEIGAPEPAEDEEVIGTPVEDPEDDPSNPEGEDTDGGEEEDASAKQAA